MTTPHHVSSFPLVDAWVERTLSIPVEGRTVTGAARANWGAVEVTILSPITHVTWRWDGRGWAFAMLASNRPESRFAFGGAFTAHGLQTAERMLTDIWLDWLAVSRHEAEADEACRRTQQELDVLAQDFADRVQPLHEQKTALRRAFKRGELTQRDYQMRRKDLDRKRDRIDQERREAERVIHGRFEATLEGRCGRRVSLEEVERLLSEVAIVVWEVPAHVAVQ
jgi:hypothetical protein